MGISGNREGAEASCSSAGMEAAGALHVGPGRSPAMKAALSTWVRVVRDIGVTTAEHNRKNLVDEKVAKLFV